MAAAGEAIFANLGLLFAIGVAVGFAKDDNGAAGLAGVVCFLVASQGRPGPDGRAAPTCRRRPCRARRPIWPAGASRPRRSTRLSVPIGILSGLIAGGLLYNRFGTIKLPEYLAFFGGRRFVPIVSGLGGAGAGGGVRAGLERASTAGIDALSRGIVAAGPSRACSLYGVLNRLLIVTGLHHILNNVAWFIIGDYHGADRRPEPLLRRRSHRRRVHEPAFSR